MLQESRDLFILMFVCFFVSQQISKWEIEKQLLTTYVAGEQRRSSSSTCALPVHPPGDLSRQAARVEPAQLCHCHCLCYIVIIFVIVLVTLSLYLSLSLLHCHCLCHCLCCIVIIFVIVFVALSLSLSLALNLCILVKCCISWSQSEETSSQVEKMQVSCEQEMWSILSWRPLQTTWQGLHDGHDSDHVIG